jgi:hypothetical protein
MFDRHGAAKPFHIGQVIRTLDPVEAPCGRRNYAAEIGHSTTSFILLSAQ